MTKKDDVPPGYHLLEDGGGISGSNKDLRKGLKREQRLRER